MTWTVAKDTGEVSVANWGAAYDGKRPGMKQFNEPMIDDLSSAAAAAAAAALEASPEHRLALFPGQTKEIYEDLLQRLPMMIQVLDGDGKIISVNEASYDLLGYHPSEIIGSHAHDLLTAEARDMVIRDVLPEFFESGHFAHVDIQFQRKDGSIRDATMAAIGYRNAKGRIERSVVVFADMSDRARAEIRLAKSEQRFRGSFELAAHGMFILDAGARINAVNRAGCEMLGRSDEDLNQQALFDLVVEQDRPKLHELIDKLLRKDVSGGMLELGYQQSDGRVLSGHTSLSAVTTSQGRVFQLIAQVVDMTTRHKAEETLRQAQKMEAVGQLTGGIAHDFNNLLTVVIGNLQLVEGALAGNDKALKRAREAIAAAQRGSDLTRQLLAFARRQSLAPREIEVNELISRMGDILRRSIGETIELKIDLHGEETEIVCDPTQLETSILNMAINARDAMPEGGRLTIETSRVHLGADYAADNSEVKAGNYVMIAVSDTGTGIPRHLQHKVFQPFFTTKDVGTGTGLGLSMVFGFIKQSGGHVKVYSEEGRGTAFKLYLPIANDQPVAAEAEPDGKRKAKILVVEDQESVRMVAVDFMEDFGYEVLEAENAVTALQILQDTPDIDLLFTDVVMPGGMNGFDLSQAASILRPELKIIHASGYPKGAMVHQEEPRLKDNLISKPYQRDELRQILADTLAGKGRIGRG